MRGQSHLASMSNIAFLRMGLKLSHRCACAKVAVGPSVCTHKIGIDDSDLINVRVATLSRTFREVVASQKNKSFCPGDDRAFPPRHETAALQFFVGYELLSLLCGTGARWSRG